MGQKVRTAPRFRCGIDSRILRGNVGGVGVGVHCSWELREVAAEAVHPVVVLLSVDRGHRREAVLGHGALLELVPSVLVDEHQTGGARPHGVEQGSARQIVVDEGRLRANAPQGKPQPDEDVAVHEIDGDHVFLAHALCLEPGGVLQDNLVGLGIGPLLAGVG